MNPLPEIAVSLSFFLSLFRNAASRSAIALRAAGLALLAPMLAAQTTVAVSPTTKTLTCNGTATFTATVTGAADTSVTWSSSPTAGLVNASGLFTAPATAGTVTVKATSNADSTKSASATVTVVAAPNATITASPWAGAGLAGIKASVPSVSGSTYLWTVTGGTITAGGTSNQVTYTAGAVGTLSLQCRVTNAAGDSATGTAQQTLTSTLDVSGTFTSTYPGTVTWYQNGTSVYGLQSGVLKYQGTLNGAVLTGVDPTKTSSQYFKFTFAPDGSTFSGYYSSTTNPASNGVMGSGTRQTGVVSIDLTPRFSVIQVSATQALTAVVAGTLDKRCSIVPTAGTVDASNLYTAPSMPQMTTITATATADPTKTSTFTAQVTNDGLLDISGTFTSTVPGTVTFYQAGTSVYGMQGGVVKFQGTLNGLVLTGVDPTKTTAPYFMFTFAADGNSFTGDCNSTKNPATDGSPSSGTRQAGVVSVDLTPKYYVQPVSFTWPVTVLVAGSLDKRYTLSVAGGLLGTDQSFAAPDLPQFVTFTATSVAAPTKSCVVTSQITSDGVLDITGTYTSTTTSTWAGTITFFQRGSQVWGVQGGKTTFTGLRNGLVMTGVNGGGYFAFTFAADGNSFSGLYNAPTSAVTSGYASTGTRQVGVGAFALSPLSVVMAPGWSNSFLPAVAGILDKRVAWSVIEANGGTVSSTGVYASPSAVGTFHVQASSVASPSLNATAAVTVTVRDLAIQPDWACVRPASLTHFQALVDGAPTPVTWSVLEGGAGVDANGTFQAPSGTGVFHLVATSVLDPTRSAGAVVVVSTTANPTLSLSVTNVEVPRNGTYQFTADVQGIDPSAVVWSASAGSIDGNGFFTAPDRAETVTITASIPGLASDVATAVITDGPADASFTYDVNGNLVDDGTRTFEYDGENRLVAVTITATGHRSEFTYDGFGRRVEIVEKDNAQITQDTKYVWEDTEILESRSPDGGMTLQKYFGQGLVDSDGTDLYYTRDHLGSIHELVDMQGAVRARYDYDPYGRMTKVSGDRDSVFGYTGHFWHGQSGLFLTLYRAYDPNLGRWISRDPIEEDGGMNLYAYVEANPVNAVDPLGLEVKVEWVHNARLVIVTDLQTGASARAWAYSGHIGDTGQTHEEQTSRRMEGPIPDGEYELLDYPKPGSVPDYYWLEPMDGKRDDRDSKTGRGTFRFHLGTASNGCVSVMDDSKPKTKYGQPNPYFNYFGKNHPNYDNWQKIKDIISHTKTEIVYDAQGRPRIKYGTMTAH